jgi:hypothetical protein
VRFNPKFGWYDPKDGAPVSVQRKGSGLQIIKDTPGYVSHGGPKPKWVDGRRERREDLKRTGCRELDPSEIKQMHDHTQRFRAEQQELARLPDVAYRRG